MTDATQIAEWLVGHPVVKLPPGAAAGLSAIEGLFYPAAPPLMASMVESFRRGGQRSHRGDRRRHDPERDVEIRRLWAEGTRKSEIAAAVGMTAGGIAYAIKRLGLPARQRETYIRTMQKPKPLGG